MNIKNVRTVTIGGVTYPSQIILSKVATWSLFKYTPHAFDPKYTSIIGGNYHFIKFIR